MSFYKQNPFHYFFIWKRVNYDKCFCCSNSMSVPEKYCQKGDSLSPGKKCKMRKWERDMEGKTSRVEKTEDIEKEKDIETIKEGLEREQGAASLMLTAKLSWRHHFIFNGLRRPRHCHFIFNMKWGHHRHCHKSIICHHFDRPYCHFQGAFLGVLRWQWCPSSLNLDNAKPSRHYD